MPRSALSVQGSIDHSLFFGVKLIYKIITFEPDHVDCMELHEYERGLVSDKEALIGLASISTGYTVLHNGKIICCGGVCEIKDGAEVWLIPSVYMETMPLSFFKGMKSKLTEILREYNLLKTYSRDTVEINRWMKFTGFYKKEMLKEYINGIDYILWIRNE